MATTSHRSQYVREILHWLTIFKMIFKNFHWTSCGVKWWKHENNSHADDIENNVAWDVYDIITWWSHQMEWFSALLALCAENSPVAGEFPSQRTVTRSFGVFFCASANGWVYNRDAGDLRRNHAHYGVTVMKSTFPKLYIRIPLCIPTETHWIIFVHHDEFHFFR